MATPLLLAQQQALGAIQASQASQNSTSQSQLVATQNLGQQILAAIPLPSPPLPPWQRVRVDDVDGGLESIFELVKLSSELRTFLTDDAASSGGCCESLDDFHCLLDKSSLSSDIKDTLAKRTGLSANAGNTSRLKQAWNIADKVVAAQDAAGAATVPPPAPPAHLALPDPEKLSLTESALLQHNWSSRNNFAWIGELQPAETLGGPALPRVA